MKKQPGYRPVDRDASCIGRTTELLDIVELEAVLLEYISKFGLTSRARALYQRNFATDDEQSRTMNDEPETGT